MQFGSYDYFGMCWLNFDHGPQSRDFQMTVRKALTLEHSLSVTQPQFINIITISRPWVCYRFMANGHTGCCGLVRGPHVDK